jgi:hypothetical protein
VYAACALTLSLLGSAASPMPSPTPTSPGEFFKEDHLTGADYLALYPSGEYEIIGREHMGIFHLERGTWTRDGDTLSFEPRAGLRPDRPPRPPYKGVRTTHRADVFLVWSTKDAAGIVINESQVRKDLAKGHGHPPYVFFQVTTSTFDCETGVTYPFRFHPEMNDQGQLKCDAR